MAVLGPHCCVQAFSNCQEQGLLSSCSVWASPGGFSCCRSRARGAQAQQLWHMGSAALWYVRSSQTRDQTSVPCFAGRILNRWTTREAPDIGLIQYSKAFFGVRHMTELYKQSLREWMSCSPSSWQKFSELPRGAELWAQRECERKVKVLVTQLFLTLWDPIGL